MSDISSLVAVGLITWVLSTITTLLFFYLGIWSKKKETKSERRRSIIEKKLMFLYSPLYTNIQISKERRGVRSLFTEKKMDEEGDGKYKELIDKIISKYFFLASKRLQPYLAKVYGPGFYYSDKKDTDLLLDYIEDDYKKLREEYFV